MRLILLAATIFFALEAYASATAIVALWTPVGVVIGADGWEVPDSGPPLVTCKTIVVNNVAVAEAGWLDAGTQDLRARIRDELHRDGPVSDRIINIEASVLSFVKYIDDIRTGKIVEPHPPIDPENLATQVFITYSDHGRMVADFYGDHSNGNRQASTYNRIPRFRP
jgi:hypothetical protein